MKKMNETTTQGLTLFDVILVVFIILKLVGVINWSWWWVLAPLWIELILMVVLLIGYLLFMKG